MSKKRPLSALFTISSTHVELKVHNPGNFAPSFDISLLFKHNKNIIFLLSPTTSNRHLYNNDKLFNFEISSVFKS